MRVLVFGALLLASGCQVLFPLDPDVDAGISDADPDALAVDCPTGYTVLLAGRAYRLSAPGVRLGWVEANASCELDGMGLQTGKTHLVVLGTDDERSNLVAGGMLDPLTSHWIGLNDRDMENSFEWLTDEPIVPFYPPKNREPPWASQEPSDSIPGEDCAAIAPQAGTFNDLPCMDPLAFVCECDEFARE